MTTDAGVTSYQVTDLTCNTGYAFTVTAFNDGGESEAAVTDPATTTTVICTPSAPTGFTADAVTQTTVDLSWSDASDNETGFKVYQDGEVVFTTAADATSYQVTGLTCNTGYAFTVTAFNDGGESDPAATDPPTTTTTACNQSPTDIALTPDTVAENEAIGTTVGTFNTSDPDTGDTHTYSLTTGDGDTDNGSFTIDGDALKTAAVFDFKTKVTYAIRVQTDDGNGGTYQKALTVTVTNVPENSYLLWTK